MITRDISLHMLCMHEVFCFYHSYVSICLICVVTVSRRTIIKRVKQY